MGKVSSIVLGLSIVSSTIFANPVNKLEFATMNKADSQFLFKDNANVVTLDKSEMKNTEGEGIWGAWAGAAIYLSWYTGDYFGSGHWHGSWGGFGAAVGSGFMLSPW